MPENTENRITYTHRGDGNTTIFPINWPYLKRAFVHVTLVRDPVLAADNIVDISGSVNWISDSQIEITPAPPPGSIITITRKTPSDKPLLLFKDGSTQLAADLNTVSAQLLHIAEEGRDYTEQVHDYVGKAEGYLEQLEGLTSAVKRAETAAERADQVLTLSIAVGDAPYGHAVSGSYNRETGMLTFHIPEGKRGPDGNKGETGNTGQPGPDGRQGPEGNPGPDGKEGPQGKAGPEGPQGPPGEMGGSPLPMAFGQFRIKANGMLTLSYSGSTDPEQFSINPATGKLEVSYADN